MKLHGLNALGIFGTTPKAIADGVYAYLGGANTFKVNPFRIKLLIFLPLDAPK